MGTSERRVVILDAAARLFEHYGHAKKTMADVARDAHDRGRTVYLEFDSKQAIVEEFTRNCRSVSPGAIEHVGPWPSVEDRERCGPIDDGDRCEGRLLGDPVEGARRFHREERRR